MSDSEVPTLKTFVDVQLFMAIPMSLRSELDSLSSAWECACAAARLGMFNKAFRIAAGSMQDRQAIWWGSLCVLHAFESTITDVEREAVTANASWAMESTAEWKSLARRFLENKELRPAIADLTAATVAARSPGNPEGSSGKLTAMCIANAVTASAKAFAPEAAAEPMFFELAQRVRSGELLGRGSAAFADRTGESQ